MAKITREQYNKWNAQAQNGFQFDLQHYLIWGEKTLSKKIELQDGRMVEFRIVYHNEYETKTNEHGCRWNVETGRYIPMLHITVWRPSHSGCYVSSGMGKYERIGEAQAAKKYNVLCKLSAEINTDEYMPEIAA